MENSHKNQSAHQVLKRTGIASGTLRIIEIKRPLAKGETRLALLIEIETSDKENEKIITILANELELQLFNAPAQSLEFAFENALSKANLAIKDTLLAKPKNWLNKIHILVMAASDQEMHISAVGNIHAFLIHRDKVVDVIGAQNAPVLKAPNPVKLFSNIISGHLLLNDAIAIVNESVLDYLSLERIRKTAQEDAPEASLAKFRELLQAAPANKQFGFYIIKRLAGPVHPAAAPARIAEEAARPHEAEHFPRPNAVKKLTPILAQAFQIGLSFLLKGFSRLLDKILEQLIKLGSALAQTPPIIKSLARDASARRYYGEKFTAAVAARKQTLTAGFKNMPARRKNILLATVILAVLFAGSIAGRLYSQGRIKNQAALDKLRSAITQKIDQAEASLIYQDEAHSRLLLKEATEQLAGLGTETDLKNKIQELINRLDKRVPLGEFEIIAAITPPENYENTGLVFLGGDIYYYNGPQTRVVKINPATENPSAALAVAGLEPFVRALPYDKQTLLLVGDKTATFLNVGTKSAAPKPLSLATAAPYAFTTYARNLYALSGADNSLIRFRENAYGTTPAAWLKEAYNLNEAVDLAVDGALYLLKTNGDIAVFLSGNLNREIRWTASGAPGAGLKLYTTEDLDALYVLDPREERLVVIGKSGELRAQFTSPQLKSARSFLVEKNGQDLYILAQDAILRVTLR